METRNRRCNNVDNKMKIKKEQFLLATIKEEICGVKMERVSLNSESTFENSYDKTEDDRGNPKTEVQEPVVTEEIKVSNEHPICSSACEFYTVYVKTEVNDSEFGESDGDLKLKDHPDILGSESHVSYEGILTNKMVCKIEDSEIKLERTCAETTTSILPVNKTEETSKNYVNLNSSSKGKQSIETCDPGSNKLYKCNNCSYQTTRQYSLTRHMDSQHNEKRQVYKCKVCTYEAKDKYYLLVHTKRKHEVDSLLFKCKDCTYEGKYKSDLKRHRKRRHEVDGVLYKCKDCTYETKYKSSLERHMSTTHAVDGVLYKCKDCTYETKHKYDLKRHMKTRHEVDGTLYTCKDCTFETKDKSYLIRHFQRKHLVEGVLYKCTNCTYETKHKYDLNVHMKKKHA